MNLKKGHLDSNNLFYVQLIMLSTIRLDFVKRFETTIILIFHRTRFELQLYLNQH